MITHIKHNVGTEEICKKLNELIRISNEGNINTNIQCDTNLLYDAIMDYGNSCKHYGSEIAISGAYNPSLGILSRKLAQIKGMLGLK